MNVKNRKNIIIGIVILLIMCVFFLYKSTKNPVYIEYINFGEECDKAFPVADSDCTLEQEFAVPYKMFYGVGFTIGTYDRENNSRYEVTIIDKNTNKEITKFTFNSSEVKNNNVYELILDKPIKVDTTHTYSAIIKTKSKVDEKNCIGFWADEVKENLLCAGDLYYNGEKQNANLCMNVYGGNANTFGILFTFVCEIYVMTLILYIAYLYYNKKNIKNNDFVLGGLLGIIVFGLLAMFTKQSIFCDEIDNMICGMLLSKGKIIYNDYYTQHTPVAYWLCGIFALLKAGSIEQFRLIYYILMSFIYVLLYFRHKDNFGKLKMMLLPIIQVVFGIVLAKEFTMILSDNIQAICMTALVLEFLQYWKDGKLDWKRAIIISLSIFCSFGSAFVSIYSIFALFVGVLIKEIIYWKNDGKVTFSLCVKRYWKLITACLLPFVIAMIYFIATNSLMNAYEQAFRFNTEVYSYYTKFGSNKIEPFFTGIRNFIRIIPDQIYNIEKATEVTESVVRLVVDIGVLIGIVNLIKRNNKLEAITLLFFIAFGFVRCTLRGFHATAPWSTLLTICLILFDFKILNKKQCKLATFLLIILSIFVSSIYFTKGVESLFNTKKPVSLTEQRIIQNTSDGDEIFLDCFLCESTYLIYKDRLPVNRCGYILPWYMDWYEMDTIDDLREKQPKMAIYNHDMEVWKNKDFSNYIKEYMEENYEKLIDGYDSLWIKKN